MHWCGDEIPRVASAQALIDRAWGKAPIQIDVAAKASFDSFLVDVGLMVAEQQAALSSVIEGESEDVSPQSDNIDEPNTS